MWLLDFFFFLKAEGWERDLFACEGRLDKKKKD